jgi:hypothetical protein
MSGNLDQDLAGYGIHRGDLPFLAKPFEHGAMVELVRQTLQTPPPSAESIASMVGSQMKVPKIGDEWVD